MLFFHHHSLAVRFAIFAIAVMAFILSKTLGRSRYCANEENYLKFHMISGLESFQIFVARAGRQFLWYRQRRQDFPLTTTSCWMQIRTLGLTHMQFD